MTIHIVQSGESIEAIAERYNISVSRIIIDNDLQDPQNLVPGQSIVIAYPKQTHIVQEGDTLAGIADLYNVTLRQLLRNNPIIFDRDYIIPGETLIISYDNNKGIIETNGFAYVYIGKDVLRKTLPYLTYLTILNYNFTENYQIIGEDDTEIIQMTKDAGVIPLLQVTTFITLNMETIEATLRILYNEEIQDMQIMNIANLLRSRGYYGINITFSYIDSNNYPLYNNYLSKLATLLHSEGFLVFVTIAPREIQNINEITIDKINYYEIGQIADRINLLHYDYSTNFGTPNLQTTTFIGNEFIKYAKTIIPVEKIYAGLSVIAYDWPLPYEIGVTRASSMSTNLAIVLASINGSIISYDEWAESAYFIYEVNKLGAPIQHLVWFKDARSVESRANLVVANGFKGISIWNIMYFFTQMWLVIISQYEIETLL